VLSGVPVRRPGAAALTPVAYGLAGATDATGDAYIAICSTGDTSATPTDRAERAALLMREHGFSGSPMKARSKKQAKKQKKVAAAAAAEIGGSKGGGKQKAPPPTQQVQAVLKSLESGDAAPTLERSVKGELAIHFATKSKNTTAVLELLRAKSASEQLLTEGHQKLLPIHYAAKTRNTKAIQAMFEAGGEEQLRRATSQKMLPLHLALDAGHLPTVEALVRTGSVEPQLTSRHPLTGAYPVHWICATRSSQGDGDDGGGGGGGGDDARLELLSRLVEGGGKGLLLQRDATDSLPIHLAVRGRDEALVRKLAELGGGAQFVEKDGAGRLAVELALGMLREAEELGEAREHENELQYRLRNISMASGSLN
jgi:hypothetical protein